jgi:hypothetical protein
MARKFFGSPSYEGRLPAWRIHVTAKGFSTGAKAHVSKPGVIVPARTVLYELIASHLWKLLHVLLKSLAVVNTVPTMEHEHGRDNEEPPFAVHKDLDRTSATHGPLAPRLLWGMLWVRSTSLRANLASIDIRS